MDAGHQFVWKLCDSAANCTRVLTALAPFRRLWLACMRRLQPDESIYMKLAVKKPGLEMTPIMSELDLTYKVPCVCPLALL